MAVSIVSRILLARALRAFGDGYVSVLLPAYLVSLGLSLFDVGAITTGTLLGSGVLTLVVGMHGRRYRYRAVLIAAATLMTVTGVCFASFGTFWPLLLIAIVGTLNPSSGDASVFMPLEHALLARASDDRRRTAVFARYSLVGAFVGALGALFAGIPEVVSGAFGTTAELAYRAMFALYGVLGIASVIVYLGLPASMESQRAARIAPLSQSKRIVYRLAALFSLDAFAGGFIVQSLLALWLFQKYDLSIAAAGTIFFWTGVLSAFSYLVAARIAERIGLVNTMVFTHLPSSVLLVMVPFAPTLGIAVALLLTRSALSQMDVPTRSSYVMAVVAPEERPAAASITAVPRSLAAALSPLIAGYLLSVSDFGVPLIVAGTIKIVYDLLLLATFRTVRPPEEADRPAREPRRSARRVAGSEESGADG